eukprot:CAMPEP_0194203958 /NCGR_PEP_ID=MMETSP0156-20130528/3601_1 /TAXON_ID=33649 /ORGANISM="Thalassionema nitzschioides, Strain L26-B" /LENGTH=408 /DNA_ID=CAMNT_0038929827 /DNA_START=34 /DNA_END=1260 /DNA_ORIENTATION=+
MTQQRHSFIIFLLLSVVGLVVSLERPQQQQRASLRRRRNNNKSRSSSDLALLGSKRYSQYYKPVKYYNPVDNDGSLTTKEKLKRGAVILIPTIWFLWPALESSFRNREKTYNNNNRRNSSSVTAAEARKRKNSQQQQQQQKISKITKTPKNEVSVSSTIIALVPVALVLYIFRDKWIGMFQGSIHIRERVEDKALQILDYLDMMPRYYSYPIYTLGMTLWEMLGLSTIPVETAAGMVFGWTALALSGTGKVLGATAAFWIGRKGRFASWIQNRLKSNSFLQLARASTEQTPFETASILRMSCFPEAIKNYGSAILLPIKYWMFLLGVLVHGLAFTFLWTYLGVDTAERIETTTHILPPDRRLQMLLGIAAAFGFVVSPIVMGYWVKSLTDNKYYPNQNNNHPAISMRK